MVAMSDHAGAAMRRREGLLLSWLRHERTTIAMELAALNHSCGVRPDATHNASRRQKSASSAGRRPGVLEDPETGVRACDGGGDALDSFTLSFLVQQAALAQVEEGKLVKEEDEEVVKSARRRST